MPSRPSARWDLPSVAAALALAGVTLLLLYLCAAPVFTTDLWWHLKIGETYANQGPWPVEEPLLHTAHDDAPVQHEWLFGVWVHALQSTFGFHGLRVFHAAAAAGIVWLAFRLLRAHSTSHVTVLTGTTLFVVWASPRLAQLRPDLFSIAATLWLVAWLRQGSVPAIRWVWPAGAALMLIWANIHSLFAIGLCLALAALLGLALQAGLAHACRARWSGPAAPPIAARARRVTGFLLTGFGVSLLNPRGYQQHLTFFTSSRDAAIWSIADEWLPFDPLHGAAQAGVMSTPAWIGADTLLFLLVAVAGVGFTRFLRAPSAATLERFDPVGLGLALAGAVALAVSVRFAWMLILPLAYVSAHLEFAPARRIPSPGREDSRFAWPLAAAALGLAISYPQTDLYQNFRRYFLPTDLTTWLALPYRARPYHPEAVQFLANTGVEGKAFNTYPMGGFLAYWLAPRVRTFIDGRTEHYPSEVYEDYSRIVEMRGRAPGESFLDLLDRRGVDLFVGVGTPPGYMGNRFTTTHLQGEAGWLQVSRGLRHAIYLRRNPRNQENLRRIQAYYASERVPFDPETGFDPAAVTRDAPAWAESHGMVPMGWTHALEVSQDPEAPSPREALDLVARTRLLLGAHRQQIQVEQQLLGLDPTNTAALQRLIYAQLRLGQIEPARRSARALISLRPESARAQRWSEAVEQFARSRDRARPAWQAPSRARLNRLAPLAGALPPGS